MSLVSRLVRTEDRPILLVVMVALVLLYGAAAFTNSNAVSATKAGDGSNTITGFVLSAITYNLNVNSPQNVDSVTWTVDSTPPAGTVIRTRFSTTGTWYTCSFVTTTVTCTTTSPQLTAVGATNLRVVMAQ